MLVYKFNSSGTGFAATDPNDLCIMLFARFRESSKPWPRLLYWPVTANDEG